MIDLFIEQVVSLAAATKLLPLRRKGARTHVSTLHRWATKGRRGVRLDTICIGATRYTSTEALQRFFDGVTAASDPTASLPTPLRSVSREKQIRAAERQLAQARI